MPRKYEPKSKPATVLDSSTRYFLSQDCSSHWYIVPFEKAEEWEAWTSIDEDDERAWTVPPWAKRIGGSPSLVTFTNPREDNCD